MNKYVRRIFVDATSGSYIDTVHKELCQMSEEQNSDDKKCYYIYYTNFNGREIDSTMNIDEVYSILDIDKNEEKVNHEETNEEERLKKFALDVVDDGKITFANDLRQISNYKLFIDDERFPTKPDWFVARTSEQAITAIKNYGFPKEIAFDHDLGDDDTVINFLNFLSDYVIDNNIRIPKDFKYSIHSQNPVGKENIDSKMKQLLKYFS